MKPSEYVSKGWCQHRSAQDQDGRYIPPESPMAVAWCMLGAIHVAYAEDIVQRENTIINLAHKLNITNSLVPLNIRKVINWNDNPKRQQHEVVLLLRSIGE